MPCQRCDPYLSFNFRPIYNKPASTAFVLALALFGSSLYLIFFFFFWQTLQYRDIFSWTLSCDHFFWFLFFFISSSQQTNRLRLDRVDSDCLPNGASGLDSLPLGCSFSYFFFNKKKNKTNKRGPIHSV